MIRALLNSLLLALSAAAHSEQFVAVNGYEVHYIVIGTMFLDREVASRYGLTRAPDQALVNISVLKDGRAVAAQINGEARDLLERRFDLNFREIREGSSIYYLTNLRYSDKEYWRFELQVRPDGAGEGFPVRFIQQIYRED